MFLYFFLFPEFSQNFSEILDFYFFFEYCASRKKVGNLSEITNLIVEL